MFFSKLFLTKHTIMCFFVQISFLCWLDYMHALFMHVHVTKVKKIVIKKKYCFVAHASNAINNKLVFILF